MNLLRLTAIARKEFIQIRRDPRSLLMAIAIPMLLLSAFGFALTLDVDKVPLVVWDRSGSDASREFISRFSGSRYFSYKQAISDYPSLERAIDTREALAALVIPYDFAQRVKSGRSVSVQFIADASDSNTATLATSYATAVATGYSQSISIDYALRTLGRKLTPPLDVRTRVWFNPELSSRNYIIPGLIAVIMTIIAALLTSLTVAREWERGTMEQLIATPIKGPELIIGKMVPYFVIGLFDVTVAVVMGKYVFGVPLRGSVPLLFVMASVFLVGSLGVGMLMSVVTKSQLVASQMAMVLTFLPVFLLSGFSFPIANMPTVLQYLTYVVPARYFVSLLKGIYLKGVGLDVLASEAVLLLVFAIVTLALANLLFKKKLE